ncbi:tail fiber assembly protein [Citrobacter braakii]|uniref:tail fiber assembly protein n=1 Tax=Citrobacter braakii TaxID=57706 RepID=UPI0019072ABE|nr:tail fiber assembly protein [Citrobacter braakii]MBJ8973656.1 tail fiber assembly protein [Citrobacter braakii]
MFYSKFRNAFYPEHLQDDYRNSPDGWPDDAIAVGEGVYQYLIAGLASGKIITPDYDGFPILAERPALTTEQLIALAEEEKQRLLKLTAERIAPLRDAVDEGMATAEETAALSEWKRYRVKVMRVDTTKPEWPTPPDNEAS